MSEKQIHSLGPDLTVEDVQFVSPALAHYTQEAVIDGVWTCDTTGFLGSSKNRAFIARSLFNVAFQTTVSILPLRADAKIAPSNAILFTSWSAVIG